MRTTQNTRLRYSRLHARASKGWSVCLCVFMGNFGTREAYTKGWSLSSVSVSVSVSVCVSVSISVCLSVYAQATLKQARHTQKGDGPHVSHRACMVHIKAKGAWCISKQKRAEITCAGVRMTALPNFRSTRVVMDTCRAQAQSGSCIRTKFWPRARDAGLARKESEMTWLYLCVMHLNQVLTSRKGRNNGV